jgi:hypothetical protein
MVTHPENSAFDSNAAGWQNHLIHAAIVVLFNTSPDSLFAEWKTSASDTMLALYTKLNALEYESRYKWPDFQVIGNDFANVIRFRRVLVQDLALGFSKSDLFNDFVKAPSRTVAPRLTPQIIPSPSQRPSVQRENSLTLT